jgi:hypothetical protein
MSFEKESAFMDDGEKPPLKVKAVTAEHGPAGEIRHRAELIQHKVFEAVTAPASRWSHRVSGVQADHDEKLSFALGRPMWTAG